MIYSHRYFFTVIIVRQNDERGRWSASELYAV